MHASKCYKGNVPNVFGVFICICKHFNLFPPQRNNLGYWSVFGSVFKYLHIFSGRFRECYMIKHLRIISCKLFLPYPSIHTKHFHTRGGRTPMDVRTDSVIWYLRISFCLQQKKMPHNFPFHFLLYCVWRSGTMGIISRHFLCQNHMWPRYNKYNLQSTRTDNAHLFPWAKKATIHQVTTMLATSKNDLFPGHNRLLTTGTDNSTLWLLPESHSTGG